MIQEYKNLINNFGSYEVSAILGDIKSYERLRNKHSYKQIFKEISYLLKV
jgi:hypothetical protein